MYIHTYPSHIKKYTLYNPTLTHTQAHLDLYLKRIQLMSICQYCQFFKYNSEARFLEEKKTPKGII